MTGRQIPPSGKKRRRGSPTKSNGEKSRHRPTEVPACTEATSGHVCIDCGQACKSAGGLASHRRSKHEAAAATAAPAAALVVESNADAVERSLLTLGDVPAGKAWLVADVRSLAAALDAAEPTDVPKISRELAARMNELMAEAPHDDDDWTSTAG